MMLRSVTLLFASLCLLFATAISLPAQDRILEQPSVQMIGGEPVFDPARYAHLKLSEEQLEAAHELEIAQYRFVTWMYFEFPVQLKDRENQIAIAQEEVNSLQRRITEYGRFNVWVGGGNPQFETVENLKLVLLASQKNLEQLQYERGLILQHQSIEYRVRQQAVAAARIRLRTAK